MLESFVNMLYCILTLIFVLENVFSTHSQSSVNWLNLESCDYGDTVENLCNKCVCTAKGVYHCKAKGCDRVPVIYLKKPTACQPNVVYNQLFTSCICSAEGQWPHKVCYDVFGHLPMESIKKKTCEPQGYVQVECNICRCNDNGEVDSTRCTINECDVKMPHFRKNTEGEAKKNLFGQCIVKNWYSLAPCQFCYCVDTNKLMCSTSVTQSNRQGQMNLGPTTLVHCGPGLLKEIAALVPNQKKFRSLLSSNEDGVWSNGVDVKTSQNSQVTEATTQYDLKVEKINKGPDDQLALLAQMAYYEVADADGKENKMNADDMTIDFRARFDANSPRIRKQNGGLPMTFNYDPLDAVRRSLKLVKAGECEPGTAINVKCNLCHCLKNGKMLCTDKKCH